MSISAVKVMLWLSGMKIFGAQEDTFAETTTPPFLTVMLGRSVGEGAAEALAVAERTLPETLLAVTWILVAPIPTKVTRPFWSTLATLSSSEDHWTSLRIEVSYLAVAFSCTVGYSVSSLFRYTLAEL